MKLFAIGVKLILLTLFISHKSFGTTTDTSQHSLQNRAETIIHEHHDYSRIDFLKKIDSLQRLTQFNEAVKIGTKALQVYRTSPILHSLVGESYFALENDSAARTNFTKALNYRSSVIEELTEISTKPVTPVEQQVLLIEFIVRNQSHIANVLARTNRLKQAIAYQDSTLFYLLDKEITENLVLKEALKPSLTRAYNDLGRLYALHGKQKKAFKHFHLAIQNDTTQPNSYLNVAHLLLVQGRSVTAYFQSYTMVSTGLPTGNAPPKNGAPDKFNPIGTQKNQIRSGSYQYVDEKTLKLALTYCDRAIKFEPKNAQAFLLRSEIKMVLKRNDFCEDAYFAKKYGIENVMQILNADCW